MKLYKFRPLGENKHLERIKDIINSGFYCCDFLSFNDMNEGVFSVNVHNVNIDVSKKKKYRICSFSGISALNNQLMWGHYANTGMGIVIEIEVSDCHEIKQVRYSNVTTNLNSIEAVLTRKSEDWQYEDEFRYLSKNTDEKVKIGKITKIYFGMPYKNLINYDDIKKKHSKLKKYLELKEELEKFCVTENVEYNDYEFNHQ